MTNNKMIGKYVIVRCRDAGVHAGVLERCKGRNAVLTEARRLWYHKPPQGAWYEGVALFGLAPESRISVTVPRRHLTETCDIVQCTAEAERSIRGAEAYDPPR